MATKYLDYNGLLYFWQKIKNLFAPLASPTFTGTPTAPTATTGTSTTQVATTEFVANTVGAMTSGVSDVKVDSVSVVTSGVANIPKASTTANGVMSSTDKSKLDSISMTNGIIDSSCLPSFVDDVIEAYPRANQTELGSTWLSKTSGGSALTPEAGKIYVLMADSTSYSANSQFRWGGTAYVKLADGGVSSITNGEIDTIVAS